MIFVYALQVCFAIVAVAVVVTAAAVVIAAVVAVVVSGKTLTLPSASLARPS